MAELLFVFVHGYSVTSLETYGELPLRLYNEAISRGFTARTENIFLGRYISFHDQVRLEDVARALDHAVREQVPKDHEFICISHSTGGPLVRTWWQHFYAANKRTCPMKHFIMLAPANHGSALAQLGKSRLSRVRSWFDGVEPGQGILDWLELGSQESWDLNTSWIFSNREMISQTGVFPFVVTGQDIDRRLYDHINSYTGELGSDGAVRVASANLNARYLQLVQSAAPDGSSLEIKELKQASKTAFRILKNKSHSGDKMGIMRSVRRDPSDVASEELIGVIFECLSVNNETQYLALTEKFEADSALVQKQSRIEIEIRPVRKKLYIHDRYSMVIFRVRDTNGNAVPDFDLILTAGDDDPDLLPTGFFADRQINRVNLSCVTYFVNYDVMNGSAEVIDPNGEVVRKHIPRVDKLGLMVNARPAEGFIRYAPCRINASAELFRSIIQPNSTTLIDIQLRRLVSDEIFRFEKTGGETVARSFKNTKPGDRVV
jgi:hypothetical protein